MSRNASAMGYIGVKSCKFSSIYADSYVVPNVAGGSVATGGATVTAHGKAGFVTLTAMATAAGGIEKFTVTNDCVQPGSTILFGVRSVLGADGVVGAYASSTIAGSYVLNVVNHGGTLLTAGTDLVISYLVLNPGD